MKKIKSVLDTRVEKAADKLLEYNIVENAGERFLEALRLAIKASDEEQVEERKFRGEDLGETTLIDEIARFKADYPHLGVHFEKSPDEEIGWECMITTMTMMRGEIGIFEGEGSTKRLALLDARRKPDEQRAERERVRIEEEASEREHRDREMKLDDAVFSTI